MSVTVTPLSPHIGVEIVGMSARDLVDRAAADDCLAKLHEHGVVVYREVHIDDADLVAFSRMLGEVAVVPTGEHEYPEIQTITLDPSRTNALLASYRQGNFHWHIDGATQSVPQKSTLLSAREVDEAGGDTEFASTYAAYDALPQAEKEKIADLRVIHTFAAAQERANPEASEEERASWNRVPARVHPLVWKRRDGRKSLLLGATAAEVVGWRREEGRALLDRLLEWSTQPQFVLRHHWRRGDLVLWDNTGMLHRALPFEPTSRRLLHRTTLVGEEAVA
ncbi:MAG TPA: TauD/TfdA family dioxygenase [Myxococcota bacterium]|nr:TauD/TfdA family dioxygenase [Myxococcota bacterium]